VEEEEQRRLLARLHDQDVDVDLLGVAQARSKGGEVCRRNQRRVARDLLDVSLERNVQQLVDLPSQPS
jgi:hypothetical protein